MLLLLFFFGGESLGGSEIKVQDLKNSETIDLRNKTLGYASMIVISQLLSTNVHVKCIM